MEILIVRKNDDGFNNGNLQYDEMYENIVGDGTNSIDVVVGRLLLVLGFKSKLIGTTYLREAILLRYSNPNARRKGLISDIYPAVAEKQESTVNRVERAIRNTINECYNRGTLISLNDLFKCQVISPVYAPTNGELLSSIVDWLQIERQQQRVK